MKIQSWATDYFGHDQRIIKEVEDFVAESLILKDGKDGLVQFASSEAKIPLEKQPTVLAEAFGKLINLLADKGILTCEEVTNIVDYHPREASFIKE